MTVHAPDDTHVDELRLLEAEAVHFIREVVAELTKPVLLFSAGKDSIVLLPRPARRRARTHTDRRVGTGKHRQRSCSRSRAGRVT